MPVTRLPAVGMLRVILPWHTGEWTCYRRSAMNDGCPPGDGCCPAGQPPAPVIGSLQEEAELAAITKALGHPMRVRMLRILVERQTCLCGDLVDELPISQATVSQHLGVLKEAGLVQGEINGPRVCYCASRERLERLAALLTLLGQSQPTKEREVLAI